MSSLRARLPGRPITATRLAPAAAIIGGLLWSLFGVFEMLNPFGPAKQYLPSLGYELVTHPALFMLYHLPGGVSLALLSLALSGVSAGLSLAYAGRRPLAFLVVGLALLSLAGSLTLFAPLAIAGLSLGRLLLGVSALVAAVQLLRRASDRALGTLLLLLGLLGIFLLALQPLTWALMWFPAGLSAVVMVLFGLGWVALGLSLERFFADGASHAHAGR